MANIYTRTPSFNNIELLEDCELLQADYYQVEQLYAQFHDLEACGRLVAIHCFLEENERNRSFQRLTAKERYQQLLQEKPAILNRVNLGHIASYIGISQVQLSRIRREMAQSL